jgi:hypothetical protein
MGKRVCSNTTTRISLWRGNFQTGMPVLAGWLEKKGHLIKNWKKRYVTIEENELSYYQDDSLIQKKGGIQLNETTKVLLVDGRTHSWKFRIISQGKCLELSAVSENERDFWVSTIRELFGSQMGKTGTQSVSNLSSENISIYTTNDSDNDDEDSDDDNSDHHELTNPPQTANEECGVRFPDIPFDLLPDLDDLIGK